MSSNENQQVAEKRAKLQPDTLVRVEIFRKNDKPFDGRLGRQDLKKLWVEALRRPESDLDGLASVQIRGRALRVNYRLKKAIDISSIFKKSDFEWERPSNLQTDFYVGRILDLSSAPVNVGDIVTVCVNRTALEFTSEQIEDWLSAYGEIKGKFKYHVDQGGLKTDEIEVEVKLSDHIPEYLPMYGRKIRIYYHGMQKQCNHCMDLGHLKADCTGEKCDWFAYIDSFIDSGDFDIKLFGEWPAIIKRKRNHTNSNPSRGRGRGRHTSNQADGETDDKQHGRGRGIKKGRGRGRGK